MPEVCVSKCRMVIGRAAGRVSYVASFSLNFVITRRLSKPGKYFDTGSSSFSFPSSSKIMPATDVTGLVIEAIAKMAFTGIAILWATSSLPAAPS